MEHELLKIKQTIFALTRSTVDIMTYSKFANCSKPQSTIKVDIYYIRVQPKKIKKKHPSRVFRYEIYETLSKCKMRSDVSEWASCGFAVCFYCLCLSRYSLPLSDNIPFRQSGTRGGSVPRRNNTCRRQGA